MAKMMAKTDATIVALQTEVLNLKTTLAKLAAPNPAAVDDDGGGLSVMCNNADGGGGAPEIVAGEDGELEIKACGGSIALHSGRCSVDPCQMQDDMRHLQTKLDALGNL